MPSPRFVANRLLFRIVFAKGFGKLNRLGIEKVFVRLRAGKGGVGILIIDPGKKGLIGVTRYRSTHEIDRFVSEAFGNVVFAIRFEFEGAVGLFVFRVSVVVAEAYLIELIPDLIELFVSEQVIFTEHASAVVRLFKRSSEVGNSGIDRRPIVPTVMLAYVGASSEADTTRSAERRLAIVAVKAYSLFGKPVDMTRSDNRMAIAT